MKGKLPIDPFYIYYFGLILMAVGLPISASMMSISQFVMLGAWLLSGDLKGKLHSFFHNPLALIITSIFALHLLGLLYTTDMDFGMHDVKIKIPLLLPFVISTMPKLKAQQFRTVLYFFCASALFGSLVGCAKLLGFGKTVITDVREISPFISHIRFSLMICFAIFILAYFSQRTISFKYKLLHYLLIGWFLVFMLILESLTGLIALFTVGAIVLTRFIFKRKNVLLKILYCASVAGCVFFIYSRIKKQVDDFYTVRETADLAHLDTLSPHGHPYLHDLKNNTIENGYYTGIYQCWEEMEPAWNKRSKIKFMDHDEKGNEIRYTIVRFLSSKGLRKDEDGIAALNEAEIHQIEKGIPDVRYASMSTLSIRIDGIIWEFNEFKKGKDPSGHSVTQRFEFWKAALGIIKKHPLIGVGTGDPEMAFKEEYNSNGTLLKEPYRHRSHDQYLAIGVAFGIVGLCWFLFSLFYPLSFRVHRMDLLYLTFFMIILLSMVNEDTLETQAGVSFFAFFNAFLLFAGEKDSDPPVQL